jgi:DNA-binding NarL/FixJ family response regulator
MQAPAPVAVARFEDLIAMGLRALLDADASVSVVANDVAYDRIPVVLRALHPQVLILDLGALRDPAQVRELSSEHPGTRLVLLGTGVSTAESSQLLAFGASACLGRDTQARDVRNAIHLASRGLQMMPHALPGAAGPRPGDSLLTQREGEVLQLLREGRSNAEIALALQIGMETVRTHARNIYGKLGVANRRALVALPAPWVAPHVPQRPPVIRPVRRHATSVASAHRRHR